MAHKQTVIIIFIYLFIYFYFYECVSLLINTSKSIFERCVFVFI